MANIKQVMIFIVEGPTEETALAQILSRIFSTNQVKFEIVHGDITNMRGADPRERVRDFILQSLGRNGYRWKDIVRIVQIGDTDGAFIPDAYVKESQDGGIHYGEDEIYAVDVDAMRKRNARKKRAMEELAGISVITYKGTGVPYSIYFFSRNMEHALHDESGELGTEQKVRLAQRFRRRYASRIDEFKQFITSPEVANDGDYREIWRRIGEGTASLRRGSNLHLLVVDGFAPSPVLPSTVNEG